MWQVRAKQVVLAAGAIERPLVFPGNDRPGVMLADAARTYLNRYGVRCGSRAVVVTSHDAAYGAALAAAGHGPISTEIAPAGPFYYAEDYHQQYLHKNPRGYCGVGGTGVSCPIGVAV